MRTVDCTPSWQSASAIYLAALASKNASARNLAEIEVKRMAKIADLSVSMSKVLESVRDLLTNPEATDVDANRVTAIVEAELQKLSSASE